MSLIYDALKEQTGPVATGPVRTRASWWARQPVPARRSMLIGGLVPLAVAVAYLAFSAAKPRDSGAAITAAATATGSTSSPLPSAPAAVPMVVEMASTSQLDSTSEQDTAAVMPELSLAPVTTVTAAVQSDVIVAEPTIPAPATTTAPIASPLPTPAPVDTGSAAPVASQPPINITVERNAVGNRPEAYDGSVARAVEAIESAMSIGDLPQARQALGRLDVLLPEESLTLLRMQAWVAHAGDDAVSAEKLYRRIVERVPDDVNAGVNIALLDARRGDLQDARQRLTRLSGRNPRSMQVSRALAELDGMQ